MAGLESIALAVAHLEREAEKGSLRARDQYRQPSKVSPGSDCKSLLFTMSPAPPRCSFNNNVARRVSTDSNYSDDPNPVSEVPHATPVSQMLKTSTAPQPPQPPQPPQAPDIASCLESLSEPEPDTPPPPPPSPTDVITQVLESDVLCGRGGETNHHPGNVKYRGLVKRFQPLYIVSKRRDKPRIAEKIVRTIRQRGGRFLKKDTESNTWRDVGNNKAREKTSQALREGAPELRSTPKGREEPFAITHMSNSHMMKKFDRSSDLPNHVHTPVVETEPGDIVGIGFASNSPGFVSTPPGFISCSPGSTKRRRLNLGDYAAAPTPRGLAGIVSPPTHPKSQFCVLSPSAFSATVSADDEDLQSEETNSTRSTRGPRLKLLKKRLQHDKNL